MKRIIGILAIVALAGLWAEAASAQYYSDYVDIGTPASEGEPMGVAPHNMVGWGPIEPDTHTGNYGGIASEDPPGSCRPIWSPTEYDALDGIENWADLDLDFGLPGGTKTLKIRHLDGGSNDGHTLHIDGVLITTFSPLGASGENWYWMELDVSAYSGVHTLRWTATAPAGTYFDPYGQVCIDKVYVEIDSETYIAPTVADADPINCSGAKPVDFRFTNVGTQAIRGYSVRVQCSPELSFTESDVSFNVVPAGASESHFVTENVAGSDYTIDYSVLGATAGIPSDVDLFTIDFHGEADGVGVVSIVEGTLGTVDGPLVGVDVLGTANVNVDCTASDVPTLDAEPEFTAGAANTVSWSDESLSGAAQYNAQCSLDDFATFVESGWDDVLSHEFDGLIDGQLYKYRVQSRDILENASGWSATEQSTQDATAPATLLNDLPLHVDSFFDITYEIELPAEVSGVASVQLFYKKDGDIDYTAGDFFPLPPAAQTLTFDASALDEGLYTFYTIAIDAVGNAELPPGGGFDTSTTLDKTAPATRVSDLDPVYIESFFDVYYELEIPEVSGVASVDLYYKKEGGTYALYGTFADDVTPLSFDTGAGGTGTGDGTYYFYAIGTDAVGNIEEAPTGPDYDATTLVDTAGPQVASFLIDDGAEYVNGLAVNLDSDVADVAEMRFRDQGGTWIEWEGYAADRAWTLPAGDGTKTVEAEFKDSSGNVTSVSDAIILDTTAPAPVADIDAGRGNLKINLGWANPDDGETEIEVWRGAWVGFYPTIEDTVLVYPEFDDWDNDVIPARPASRDAAAADPFWKRVATLSAPDAAYIDDDGGATLARNVYYYEIFVRDAAGNWSDPAAENDAATSYLLGDFAGDDGVIELATDIQTFALTYGLDDGESLYNNECDIGPTDDYSGDGIPTTDDTVGFEDLMIVALNYDTELAKSQPVEGGLIASLGWERVSENSWSLMLLEPCRDLKGLRLTADVAAGAVRSFAAGKLVGGQDGPFFAQNIASRGLDAGLALLGRDVRIIGQGELLRLDLGGDLDIADIVVEARNSANEMVEIMFAEATESQPLPTAYALAENYPNPFNPATTIDFALPEPQRVRLAVYAVDGRLIATLKDESMTAGRHSVVWNGRNDGGDPVASGIYFYRIEAGPFSRTCKMTLLK